MSKIAIVSALVSAAALATPVAAQEQFAGSWTIERADPAPWVEAGFTVDAAYVAEYVGKTVTFGAGIEGPGLLACATPTYTAYDTPADGLFQGGLAEDGDSAKADAAATKIGFTMRPIHSIDTGCEHDIDFHMSDADHAAFALDNMIYWLKRDAATTP